MELDLTVFEHLWKWLGKFRVELLDLLGGFGPTTLFVASCLDLRRCALFA